MPAISRVGAIAAQRQSREQPPLAVGPGWNAAALAAAVAVTVGWFLAYSRGRREGFCDEAGHMGILYHFAEGKPGLPDNLTMLPGYHFVVLTLTHFHPTDTSARFTTLLFALLGLGGFAGAWADTHRRRPGPAVLLLALLPIFQPFAGMAYSDVPGVAVLLWAWWAQLRGQHWAAALLLALAGAVRQTNLIWGGFFLAWEYLAARQLVPVPVPRPPALSPGAAVRHVLRRGAGILLLGALAAGVGLWAGRLTPGTENGNPLRPNRAVLDFGALLFLALGWPALLRPLAALLQRARSLAPRSPAGLAAAIAGSVAAAAGLAATYANPHPWNQDLYFSATHFTLLRNWPLVFASAHPWFRWVPAAGVVATGWLFARGLARQPNRRELWLTLPFGAVLLASNFLVDPRYYLTPAVFLLCFWTFTGREFLGLAAWFAVICLVQAPFIVAGKALW